jgi:hypothetical protein
MKRHIFRLKAEIIEPHKRPPALTFYGFDRKGRHVTGPGYGLFC